MKDAASATSVVTGLFESWYAAMVRFAAHSIRNEETAEEIVQEAFTDLYKELRAGKRVDHPKAWTMRVIRRRIWREFQEPKLEALDEVPEPATANLAGASELSLLLRRLTPREAEATLLRAAGLGYAEIGRELGIATGTVGALLARALHRMQDSVAHTTQSRSAKR
jgi:RNA polymerase sigma factor (sigma-70 family)